MKITMSNLEETAQAESTRKERADRYNQIKSCVALNVSASRLKEVLNLAELNIARTDRKSAQEWVITMQFEDQPNLQVFIARHSATAFEVGFVTQQIKAHAEKAKLLGILNNAVMEMTELRQFKDKQLNLEDSSTYKVVTFHGCNLRVHKDYSYLFATDPAMVLLHDTLLTMLTSEEKENERW